MVLFIQPDRSQTSDYFLCAFFCCSHLIPIDIPLQGVRQGFLSVLSFRPYMKLPLETDLNLHNTLALNQRAVGKQSNAMGNKINPFGAIHKAFAHTHTHTHTPSRSAPQKGAGKRSVQVSAAVCVCVFPLYGRSVYPML